MSRSIIAPGALGVLSLALLIFSRGPIDAASALTWQRGASMAAERVATNGSASGGKLYVTGGFNGPFQNGNTLASVEEYDPSANQWRGRSNLPIATKFHGQTTAPDGRIYVAGGVLGSSILSAFQEYTPASDSWRTRASMATARTFRPGLAAAPNGRIYVVGGGSEQDYLTSVEEFDPTTNSWRPRASMAVARGAPVVLTSTNGRIYAIGGINSGGYLGTVEEYDPATDQWRSRASMTSRRYLAAGAVGPTGKLYVLGGFGEGTGDYDPQLNRYVPDSGTLRTVEEYDPATDSWTTLTPLPSSRREFGAAFIAPDRLLAAGGANSDNTILSTLDVGTLIEIVPTVTPTVTCTPSPIPSGPEVPSPGANARTYLPLAERPAARAC